MAKANTKAAGKKPDKPEKPAKPDKPAAGEKSPYAEEEGPRGRPMKVEAGTAIVRMYCTGLGDCFLIGLPGKNGKTAYVWIDCGVWKGTPGATAWMRQIVEHIAATVNGDGIEILVATHAHWDHLSGFGQAADILKKIEVRNVWMAWTENPKDPVASGVTAERQLAVRAAVAAASKLHMEAKRAEDDQREEDRKRIQATADHIEHLLKFSGHTPRGDEAAKAEDDALRKAGVIGARAAAGENLGLGADLAAAAQGTDDLLDLVRKLVPEPTYLKPSLKPVPTSAIDGVRIYALGPPTDLTLLGRDDPSKAAGKSEVYLGPNLGSLPLNETTALLAAVMAGGSSADLRAGANPEAGDIDPDARAMQQLTYPIDPIYQLSSARVEKDPRHAPFFNTYYNNAQEDWRRIDTDWLDVGEQLALNFDSHINNQSLVLAFELGDSADAPVLLFPADAQVGNWLSWHQLERVESFPSAADLLGRTVLYKVGHHASHNATLKDLGLKLMTQSSRLTAMIPISQEEAHKPKGSNKNGWDMPYDKMMTDLEERTQGRILRADQGVPLLERDDQAAPADWPADAWERFKQDVRVFPPTEKVETDPKANRVQAVPKPLYIEFVVRAHQTEKPVKPKRKARG